jgi:predicted nucleic acid-binding Zn ribbon protein
MRERKPKEDFSHIGSIIGNVLREFMPESAGELTRVWQIWDDAVGETIAANAQPVAFKGDVLLVHATSSTWIHQLQFLKADMITKLNAAVGKAVISEIKFKIGPFS